MGISIKFGVALFRKYSSNWVCKAEGIANMKNPPISVYSVKLHDIHKVKING